MARLSRYRLWLFELQYPIAFLVLHGNRRFDRLGSSSCAAQPKIPNTPRGTHGRIPSALESLLVQIPTWPALSQPPQLRHLHYSVSRVQVAMARATTKDISHFGLVSQEVPPFDIPLTIPSQR